MDHLFKSNLKDVENKLRDKLGDRYKDELAVLIHNILVNSALFCIKYLDAKDSNVALDSDLLQDRFHKMSVIIEAFTNNLITLADTGQILEIEELFQAITEKYMEYIKMLALTKSGEAVIQ